LLLVFVSLFERLTYNRFFLAAGTPGFSAQEQFTFGNGYRVMNFMYFLLCNWRTSWTLLYKPIDEKERKEIDKIVDVSVLFAEIKLILISDMQCSFNPRNKRRQQSSSNLRNHVDHLNSIVVLPFLPRRSKFDEIAQCFNFGSKRDESCQPRSGKYHEERV